MPCAPLWKDYRPASPFDQPLVQNAGKPTRQQAWDTCYSAPKSVSVLWSQADPQTRAAIEAAHDAAVRAGCDYVEQSAGWTRRGRGGATREPAKLVFALFEHGSSRMGDPQLHTHALLFNLGIRADGSTGSIESKPIYQHKMTAGAVYRAELAVQLEQRLGLTVTRKGTLFDVAGVPDTLCRAFSQRRAQIEQQIKLRGTQTAAGAAAIAVATRTAKKAVTRDTLREQWKKVGASFGFGEPEVARLLKPSPRHKADATPLFRAGVAHLMEGESHFTERALLRFVAEAAPGTGLGAADLHRRHEAVSCPGTHARSHRPAVLHHAGPARDGKRAAVRGAAAPCQPAARGGAGNGHAKPRRKRKKRQAPSKRRPVKLSAEQQAALDYVTLQPGSVKIVSGMAGTGKTFFLSAAKNAWEDAGYKVIGASLCGQGGAGLTGRGGD